MTKKTANTAMLEVEPDKTGCAQIIEGCGAELMRLAEQRRGLEIAIAHHTAELAQLASAGKERSQNLTMFRSLLASAQQECEQARNYSLHAQNTLNEAMAIKRLAVAERTLTQQQASVAELEASTTAAQARDDERAGVCSATIEQARLDLATVDRQQYSAQQAIEMAKREHGALVYREVSTRIAAHQATIAERKQSVVEAQLELEEYLRQEALAQLSDYSAHRAKILALLPVSDAVSRCFTAELAYIDTLLTSGRELPYAPLNIPAASNYVFWRALLAVPDGEIYNDESLGGNPRMLHRRRRIVGEALEQWTARLRQQQR